MSMNDVINRTIKCDAPDCDKTVTFNPQVEGDILALPDWLRTARTITLGNNAKFMYCSDVCEVKGVTTGNHNVPEPKQVEGATPAQAALAGKQSDAVNKLRQPAPTDKKISLS